MKKETSIHRNIISNDLMHYIYDNIDSQINLDTLSEDFKISKFHMHRLFKEQFGKNIYKTIKKVRLQKAADLLIANEKLTISDISAMCGYGSQTSFIRAFHAEYKMTPKAWRKGGFIGFSEAIIEQSDVERLSTKEYKNLSPIIKKMPSVRVYYIRHTGYDASIKECWQKLQTSLLSRDIEHYLEIALFHDNPLITPLSECNYVACVTIEEPFDSKKISLPHFEIHGGVYAEFSASGYKNDILRVIQWVYHEWLPKSGYETTTKHAYIIYEENDFLNESGFFSLKYYVPIVFI